MALAHVIEKLSGDYQQLALPLFIYDNGQPPVAIDEDDVVTYLNTPPAGIPTDVLGVPDDGNPTIERLSKSAFRVVIKYKLDTLRPLTPPGTGTKRSRFQFQLPRRFVRWSTEVGKFPTSSLSWRGLVNVAQDFESGAWTSGVWLEPPPVSFTTEQSFTTATVTATWVRTLAAVIQAGAVNSDALGGGAYAAGELLIGHCNGQQISASAFMIETGWCWQKNVTAPGETRDGITGIVYDGHDFVWEEFEPLTDRNNVRLGLKIKGVFVNRVRPRVAFSGLGISPP